MRTYIFQKFNTRKYLQRYLLDQSPRCFFDPKSKIVFATFSPWKKSLRIISSFPWRQGRQKSYSLPCWIVISYLLGPCRILWTIKPRELTIIFLHFCPQPTLIPSAQCKCLSFPLFIWCDFLIYILVHPNYLKEW